MQFVVRLSLMQNVLSEFSRLKIQLDFVIHPGVNGGTDYAKPPSLATPRIG
jgi:hypothetical protein